MSLLDTFKEKAKANKKKIVLPEGNELRTLKGAVIAAQEGLAEPILLGDKAEIIALAEKERLLLDGVTVVDIAGSEHLDDFAEFFYELRKHKGMTPEKAAQTVRNPLYFGNLMLMKGTECSCG